MSAEDGELDRLHVDPVMRPEVSRAFLANAQLMRELAVRPGGGPGPLVAARLREQVLTTLLLAQPHSWTDVLLGGRERPSASKVREAANLMVDRAGEPLTVEAIAREVGLSVRALHMGFRREFDVAPSRYLQQVRLDRAHADLRSAEPGVRVADVARWWGFGNLGRFASAYRARFGVTPGETLRARRMR